MQWEIWLVPLIAMAVWILGSLLRGSVEDRTRNQREPQRPNQGGRPPEGERGQRPMTDLEKFLQEVNRRRETGEPPPAPAKVESKPKPREVPAPAGPPPASPSRRPPRQPVPASKRSRPRQTETPSVVQVVVVEEGKPALVPPLPSADVPPSVIPVAAAAPPVRGVPAAAPAAQRPREVRIPQTLAALLSSREGLRNALILREILDPPLCKRR